VIQLVEKRQPQLKAWLVDMWAHYRDELLRAGETPEGAEQNIARNEAVLFKDGEPAEGQFIFDVVSDDVSIGSLWLGKRSDHEWYVYDVVIDEGFRGKGFGRQTMQAAEDFAKSKNGSRIALNVFGPNAVARKLYGSMGYNEMAIAMFKDL